MTAELNSAEQELGIVLCQEVCKCLCIYAFFLSRLKCKCW